MVQDFRWGPTIAMSWLWGLGFFFSIHFSFLYGWPGLLAFAIPNALGLYLFGRGLHRLGQSNDLTHWLEQKLKSGSAIFFAFQIVAISLTVFAIMKYLLAELGFDVPIAWVLALLALAMLASEMAGLAGLVRLHTVYFLIFVGLGLSILFASPALDVPMAPRAYDLTFVGVLIPLLVSLLFGPWLDLQQWQRAMAMQKQGRNVERGFAAGAVLFFALLLIVGGLSMAYVPGLTEVAPSGIDGQLHAGGVLTSALQSAGVPLALLAFGILAGLAILSTLDSGHLAIRWHLAYLNRTSDNPLLGMLPDGLRSSTVPTFILTVSIAMAALYFGGDVEHFMIFFASIFLAGGVALVLTAFWPARAAVPNGTVFLVGALALALLAIGYFEAQPWMMIVGVLIPVIVLPILFFLQPAALPVDGTAQAQEKAQGIIADTPDAVPPLVQTGSEESSAGELTVDRTARSSDGWFDDHWFTVPHIPTYTDTNSVGNVYFANYIAWVGKTRELFFRACMPDFKIEETDFYILTRSFNHKFIREIKEFQSVRIRLRIGGFNRKFVKLEHQIEGTDSALIGAGDQTLMFVESKNYGLIDIPGRVYSAFIKYAPVGGGKV